MAIRIGDVWDRTTAVIADRGGALFGIALLLAALPTIVHDAVVAYGGPSAGMKLFAGLLNLVVAALTIWGTLSMIAVASEPGVDRARGLSLGGSRWLAGVGVTLLLLVVVAVLFVPAGVLMAASGFDFTRAQAGLEQVNLSTGPLAAAVLYSLVATLFLLWAAARLFVLYPVILHERLGAGAIRRSFALTRGYTWKLIGVLILYVIVFLVVLAAASGIIGVIVGLILGREQAATTTFIVAIVAALITAGFSVLQAVFPTRFYLAVRDEKDGVAAPVAPA